MGIFVALFRSSELNQQLLIKFEKLKRENQLNFEFQLGSVIVLKQEH